LAVFLDSWDKMIGGDGRDQAVWSKNSRKNVRQRPYIPTHRNKSELESVRVSNLSLNFNRIPNWGSKRSRSKSRSMMATGKLSDSMIVSSRRLKSKQVSSTNNPQDIAQPLQAHGNFSNGPNHFAPQTLIQLNAPPRNKAHGVERNPIRQQNKFKIQHSSPSLSLRPSFLQHQNQHQTRMTSNRKSVASLLMGTGYEQRINWVTRKEKDTKTFLSYDGIQSRNQHHHHQQQRHQSSRTIAGNVHKAINLNRSSIRNHSKDVTSNIGGSSTPELKSTYLGESGASNSRDGTNEGVVRPSRRGVGGSGPAVAAAAAGSRSVEFQRSTTERKMKSSSSTSRLRLRDQELQQDRQSNSEAIPAKAATAATKKSIQPLTSTRTLNQTGGGGALDQDSDVSLHRRAKLATDILHFNFVRSGKRPSRKSSSVPAVATSSSSSSLLPGGRQGGSSRIRADRITRTTSTSPHNGSSSRATVDRTIKSSSKSPCRGRRLSSRQQSTVVLSPLGTETEKETTKKFSSYSPKASLTPSSSSRIITSTTTSSSSITNHQSSSDSRRPLPPRSKLDQRHSSVRPPNNNNDDNSTNTIAATVAAVISEAASGIRTSPKNHHHQSSSSNSSILQPAAQYIQSPESVNENLQIRTILAEKLEKFIGSAESLVDQIEEQIIGKNSNSKATPTPTAAAINVSHPQQHCISSSSNKAVNMSPTSRRRYTAQFSFSRQQQQQSLANSSEKAAGGNKSQVAPSSPSLVSTEMFKAAPGVSGWGRRTLMKRRKRERGAQRHNYTWTNELLGGELAMRIRECSFECQGKELLGPWSLSTSSETTLGTITKAHRRAGFGFLVACNHWNSVSPSKQTFLMNPQTEKKAFTIYKELVADLANEMFLSEEELDTLDKGWEVLGRKDRKEVHEEVGGSLEYLRGKVAKRTILVTPKKWSPQLIQKWIQKVEHGRLAGYASSLKGMSGTRVMQIRSTDELKKIGVKELHFNIALKSIHRLHRAEVCLQKCVQLCSRIDQRSAGALQRGRKCEITARRNETLAKKQYLKNRKRESQLMIRLARKMGIEAADAPSDEEFSSDYDSEDSGDYGSSSGEESSSADESDGASSDYDDDDNSSVKGMSNREKKELWRRQQKEASLAHRKEMRSPVMRKARDSRERANQELESCLIMIAKKVRALTTIRMGITELFT